MTTLATILDRTTDLLIGCWHVNYSFPMTRRQNGKLVTTTCCLNCGKEFHYDLEKMRVGRRVQ
jgi:hypothetical protein